VDKDLVVEARPVVERGLVRTGEPLDWSALSFTVLVTPLVPGLPIWVLFDEHPQGFQTTRLLPVFADTGPPGRAYCFVDSGYYALLAIEWALNRYGLRLDQFRWAA
jgi:hypothetical protein